MVNTYADGVAGDFVTLAEKYSDMTAHMPETVMPCGCMRVDLADGETFEIHHVRACTSNNVLRLDRLAIKAIAAERKAIQEAREALFKSRGRN